LTSLRQQITAAFDVANRKNLVADFLAQTMDVDLGSIATASHVVWRNILDEALFRNNLPDPLEQYL